MIIAARSSPSASTGSPASRNRCSGSGSPARRASRASPRTRRRGCGRRRPRRPAARAGRRIPRRCEATGRPRRVPVTQPSHAGRGDRPRPMAPAGTVRVAWSRRRLESSMTDRSPAIGRVGARLLGHAAAPRPRRGRCWPGVVAVLAVRVYAAGLRGRQRHVADARHVGRARRRAPLRAVAPARLPAARGRHRGDGGLGGHWPSNLVSVLLGGGDARRCSTASSGGAPARRRRPRCSSRCSG